MSIIFSILLFSFLIFIHEFGHFMAAKLSGVQVNEFAIFMGPAIVKWRRGETLYSIRCIPIGGYCAMEGENEDTDNPRSFQKAAWWKRLIILVAGSFMNFVTGVVIIAVVLSCYPNYASTKIEKIESWSCFAEDHTLQQGDIIKELDGKKIRIYEDFSLKLWNLPAGNYDVVVERNGQKVELDDVRFEILNPEENRYGLSFGREETTASSVMKQILPTAGNYVDQVFVSLGMLFSGQAGLQDLSGPVGIVDQMNQMAEASANAWYAFLTLLNIGGLLAINLAVMNMLPIPALDGGRTVGLLLTTAVEKITRKKVSAKIEGYIHGVGMILLLALMAFILFKDVFTIFMR